MLKLYGFSLSANVHRVRLMLGVLGLPYEEIPVDIAAGEHKSAEFLKINPFGQVPVFEDDALRLRDSYAAMVYLARKHGAQTWVPSDPAEQARVVQWLSFSANELQNGPHMARINALLGVPIDKAAVHAGSKHSLALLDAHLATREWLELGRATIADLACFPMVGLAPDGNISLQPYAHVRNWLARVKALPGYVSMPGL